MTTLQKFKAKDKLLACMATVLLAGTLVGPASAADTRITIMGGQTQGPFNRIVSGWAAMISQQVPGINASSTASAGSNASIRAIEDGKAEMGK